MSFQNIVTTPAGSTVAISINPTNKNIRLKVFCVLIVIGWQTVLLLAKHTAYKGLSYTSDVFVNFQSALAWVYGRPFLHNADYGPYSYVHNYFILLLIGPLAALFGAFALFAINAALNAAASLAALEFITGYRDNLRTLLFLPLLLVLVSGPVGIYLFDSPRFGWHPDLLFVPLSVLFLVSIAGNKTTKWLWGTLLVLIHEQGPVIAGSLHLFSVLAATPLLDKPTLKRQAGHCARLLLFYGLLFAAGMWVLNHYSGYASWRTARALNTMSSCWSVAGFKGAVASMFYYAAKLLIPGLVVISLSGGLQMGLLTLLGLLPLALISVVGSAFYFPDCQHVDITGLYYPPRLSVLWGFLLGGITLALAARAQLTASGAGAAVSRRLIRSRPALSALLLLLTLGLGLAQYQVLAGERKYEPGDFVALAFPPVFPLSQGALKINRLSPLESRALACISAKLPRNTPLAVSSYEMALFERHYAMFAHNAEKALMPPSVVICDSLNRLADNAVGETSACAELIKKKIAQGFDQAQIGAYVIAFNPSMYNKEIFTNCAK